MLHKNKQVKHNRRWQISGWHWPVSISVVLLLLTSVAFFLWSTLIPVPTLPDPPLKDLTSAKGVQLGMLAQPKDLSKKAFSQTLIAQYSLLTTDGQMHWDKFRPSPDTYAFAGADTLVDFAGRHAMAVEGHHLVWGEPDSIPKWLKQGNYSKQQLRDIMRAHISTVAGHYAGKIGTWTVVNEPFSRQQHIFGLHDWWADQLGGAAYIDDAFRWARQADPHAKLILNDFYNETESSVSNAMYDYVKAAKAKGVPIDGVGIQMHVDAAYPRSKADMVKNMQRFATLNTPVYITEFDINSSRVKADVNKTQLEARIAADVARACIESKNCVSLTMFGMADPTGLAKLTAYNKERSYPFTSRFQPKPEYYSFRDVWLSLL